MRSVPVTTGCMRATSSSAFMSHGRSSVNRCIPRSIFWAMSVEAAALIIVDMLSTTVMTLLVWSVRFVTLSPEKILFTG